MKPPCCTVVRRLSSADKALLKRIEAAERTLATHCDGFNQCAEAIAVERRRISWYGNLTFWGRLKWLLCGCGR